MASRLSADSKHRREKKVRPHVGSVRVGGHVRPGEWPNDETELEDLEDIGGPEILEQKGRQSKKDGR